MTGAAAHPVDLLVVGGGIAGLCILEAAVRAGRDALLLEPYALGHGQSVCAQGIIHGGLKYTLRPGAQDAAVAIREMPSRWRACLRGEATPDLRDARVRSEFCCLWHTTSIKSRLGMLGASAGLRIRPQKLDADQRPAPLRELPGTVARLDEQVIDPVSVLQVLAERHAGRILHIDLDATSVETDQPGVVRRVTVARADDPTTTVALAPAHLVLAAGTGNESWATRCGLAIDLAQRRPLHMLMARGRELPWLNGHCVDGAATRATITSDHTSDGRVVWQIGGRLTESDGVARDETAQIEHGRRELAAVLPGVSFDDVEWATYRVDRAERRSPGGRRPDDISVHTVGVTTVAWPTKLALAPRLADVVIDDLPTPDAPADAAATMERFGDWPRPAVASPPWEQDLAWCTDAASAPPTST